MFVVTGGGGIFHGGGIFQETGHYESKVSDKFGVAPRGRTDSISAAINNFESISIGRRR
jgi:hypothetical protein